MEKSHYINKKGLSSPLIRFNEVGGPLFFMDDILLSHLISTVE